MDGYIHLGAIVKKTGTKENATRQKSEGRCKCFEVKPLGLIESGEMRHSARIQETQALRIIYPGEKVRLCVTVWLK